MLLKSQWRYECECGFKIWHTVAKVELPEEVMNELLTTGKTKHKITGFTSKAGNVFDTCLKYENEQISFDFDNSGEPDVTNDMQAEPAKNVNMNGDDQPKVEQEQGTQTETTDVTSATQTTESSESI